MIDDDFKTFVEEHRSFGYGRMMQLISDLWRSKDPVGALTVGDTYSGCDKKLARCKAEGHDRRSGNSYDWCDRCGEQLSPRARRAQHQGSTTDQLQELIQLANANGLYDAADYLTSRVAAVGKKEER